MTNIADFEWARLERGCRDVYEPGEEVTISTSSELNSILEIAFKFLHPHEREFEPYLALSQPFIAFSRTRRKDFL